MSQQDMFAGDVNVLPLFSGTPVATSVSPFVQKDTPPLRQAILGNCRACLGIGSVDGKYCWCEAGDALRIFERSRK